MTTLLTIEALGVAFPDHHGGAPVVDGVSLTVGEGETVALVGESGSGKTMTALSVVGLLPPGARIDEGSRVIVEGTDLAAQPERARFLRGRTVGFVFQDSSAALNPVRTVGGQLKEVLVAHRGMTPEEAEAEVIPILEEVRLPDPSAQARAYPHQLSGGMRQRVLLALALAGRPQLLIADEPTSALDASVEQGILQLIRSLTDRRQLGTLLITHDFGVVAQASDRVLVMYAGEIVEEGSTATVLRAPQHPYTKALMEALPGRGAAKTPLPTLPGQMPRPGERWSQCTFLDRCTRRSERCLVRPELQSVGGRSVRCWHPELGGTP